MRKFLLFAVISLCLAVPASAQDNVKVSAAFANTDLSQNDVQGVQAELDLKALKYERFRVGGIFHYVRPTFNSCHKFDTYSAGPQLSYDVFNGRVSLFGRALFGVTTNYNGANAFTQTYGAGGDINFGHFFIRPGVIDLVKTEGAGVTNYRVGIGGGFRY